MATSYLRVQLPVGGGLAFPTYDIKGYDAWSIRGVFFTTFNGGAAAIATPRLEVQTSIGLTIFSVSSTDVGIGLTGFDMFAPGMSQTAVVTAASRQQTIPFPDLWFKEDARLQCGFTGGDATTLITFATMWLAFNK